MKNGAPGAIPTRDLPLRRRTLYAAELREHTGSKLADGLFECPEKPPLMRVRVRENLMRTSTERLLSTERFLDTPLTTNLYS